MSKEAARQARCQGRQDENGGLGPRRVDAHHGRRDLRAMEGAQGTAGAGIHEVERQQHHQQECDGYDSIPALITVDCPAKYGQRRDLANAIGPTSEATGLNQNDVDYDAEAQGRHGQIVPLQTQDGAGDQVGDQAGQHQSRAQGGPGVPAITGGKDSRGVSPQAKKGGVS